MTKFFLKSDSFNHFIKASRQSSKLIFLAEAQVKMPCNLE